jgi:hypothetical protein
MVLVARINPSFVYRYWFDDQHFGAGNGWSDWQEYPPDQLPPGDWVVAEPTPLPRHWPLLGWTDQNGAARINGFFSFSDTDGLPILAQPWWRMPGGEVVLDVADVRFETSVGAAWMDGPIPRLNVFGSTVLDEPSLRELWWDGRWHWDDHDGGVQGPPLGSQLGP